MTEQLLLAQSLTFCALLAATLEYAVLVRHRVERHTAMMALREAQAVGLRGLVRLFLTDE